MNSQDAFGIVAVFYSVAKFLASQAGQTVERDAA